MVVWKSEGEEDKFIVKLINVIRNHLNTLKRNSGLFLEELNEDQITELECSQHDVEQKVKDETNNSKDDRNAQSYCVHQNYPILCDVFKDPGTQCDKVVVAISLPGGAKNVKIDVNEDGSDVAIKYNWPETLFDMQDLFRKQLISKEMLIHHPIIISLKNLLEKVRSRIDQAPEASVVVRLPIKVQSTPESIVKLGIKRDNGTLLIVSTFTGYLKTYQKKLCDSNLEFDN